MQFDGNTSFWAFLATVAFIIQTVIQHYYAKRARQERQETNGRIETVKKVVNRNSQQLQADKNSAQDADAKRDKKLADIHQTTEIIHILVNNRLTLVLHELAMVRRQLANVTGSPEDGVAADNAQARANHQSASQYMADSEFPKVETLAPAGEAKVLPLPVLPPPPVQGGLEPVMESEKRTFKLYPEKRTENTKGEQE